MRRLTLALLLTSFVANAALTLSPDFSLGVGNLVSRVTGLDTTGRRMRELETRADRLRSELRSEKRLARAVRSERDRLGARVESLEAHLRTARSTIEQKDGRMAQTQRREGDLRRRLGTAIGERDSLRLQMERRAAQVVASRDALWRRIQKLGAGNASATLGEAVPGLGIFVIAGATAWEMTEYCFLLQDLRELSEMFELPPADQAFADAALPEAETQGRRLCGVDLPPTPSAAQLVEGMGEGLGAAYERSRSALEAYGASVQVPDWTEPGFDRISGWVEWLVDWFADPGAEAGRG